MYNYFFRYMLVRFEPTQPDIHMISKVTMVEQRWLKFNTSIWSSTKDPQKCPLPQTPTPHPPAIYTHSHPTVKASNNHSYRIDWMSIQGCSHLLKIVCNNCRSLLPLSLSTTPLLWITTERDVLQAVFENVYYDLKTHNNAWAKDCWLVLFYVLFKFNAFICMESWMLAKVTIFIIACFFAFLSNR